MKILFIGDIVGRLGRNIVTKELVGIREEFDIDFVIANAENSAHGSGITPNIVEELTSAGVDFITGGDHSFKEKTQIENVYNGKLPIIRPANFPENLPGNGAAVIEVGKHKILIANLIGRVFMKMDYDCPFRKIDDILANFAKQKLSAIIIDIHAEATSEKVAMKHYLDGRVSAVLGTHTHVMTADQQISSAGTAYISDVGMAGFNEGCIGIEIESIIATYLTQIKTPNILPESGEAILNAVILDIDEKTSETKNITPLIKKTTF